MSIKKSIESTKEFEALLESWVGVEETTIRMTSELCAKTDNIVLKTLFDAIRRDSEKHREILKVVLQNLTGTITLSPDDMAAIDTFVEGHASAEKNIIDLAEKALEKVRMPVPKLMLGYLLDDEKKHELLADGLDKLKSSAMIGT